MVEKTERPHVVWAWFPLLYWVMWAAMGLFTSWLLFGERLEGIYAFFAMGAGCVIGSFWQPWDTQDDFEHCENHDTESVGEPS